MIMITITTFQILIMFTTIMVLMVSTMNIIWINPTQPPPPPPQQQLLTMTTACSHGVSGFKRPWALHAVKLWAIKSVSMTILMVAIMTTQAITDTITCLRTLQQADRQFLLCKLHQLQALAICSRCTTRCCLKTVTMQTRTSILMLHGISAQTTTLFMHHKAGIRTRNSCRMV